MAKPPLVVCRKCKTLRRQGSPCPKCGNQERLVGWNYLQRPNSYRRGYDGRWSRLRALYLAKNPLCEECFREGKVTPATTVDHIRPFNGYADPLRLCWENLQSLCNRCHSIKSAKESHLGKKRAADEVAK